MEFIKILTLILFLSIVVSTVFNRINIPSVIGQLLLGVILGKGVLDIVKPTHSLELFAEIGVILLMFIAGLESDFKLLRKHFAPSFNVAVFGVVIPMILTFVTSIAFGIELRESTFIAVIFAATSVSISVEVLKGLNYLQSKSGTVILGAAVVDDILAISILSIMSGTLTGDFSWQSLALLVCLWIVFVVVTIASYKWIIPEILNLVKYLDAPQAPTVVVLIICFIFAVFADAVHLDAVLGAFAAGIIVSASDQYDNEIGDNIEKIGYSIFIPIFFVSIGLSLDFSNFLKDFWLIVSLTVVGIVGKLFGAGLGARISGFSNKESYIIGSGMISRGEMALIIAQIGFEVRLLSEEYYSAIIISIILITVLSPFFLKNSISRDVIE
ncbi:cation:proton antiporter [Companilactobacillus metriopterae]|uniref:cation:proton antiporter n=1 Tax=Companilactobacillus metriopterae TaxID=1909267 RepID=UPI00100A753A|nr:cation:proton antiporter [Companilactobacillus metriopterae]